MADLKDVKESMEPKEITIEWDIGDETAEIPFRLQPVSYGETVLLAKKGETEGKDRFSLQYDLLTRIVEKKEDEKWKQIERKELQSLPQGFVLQLSDEVNDFLGLGESIENFRSSLSETM